jgi:hypothetical protein
VTSIATPRPLTLAHRRSRTGIVAAISVAFCIWAGLFIQYQSFTAIDGQRYYPLFDDAYISLRYAWNLSQGNGLVWNAGERVEGYTNPLMVLVMSPVTYWFDARVAPLVVQVIGILFVLGSAGMALRLSQYLADGSDSAFTASVRAVGSFLAVVLYYPLVFMSLAGMESGLAALLVTATIVSLLRLLRTHRFRDLLTMTICVWLAYLARPEAALLAAAIYVYLLCEVYSGRVRIKHFLLGAGLFGMLVAMHLVVRFGYYGELFPNTYYLKGTGMPVAVRLENGLIYLRHLTVDNFLVFATALAAILLNFSRTRLLILGLLAVLLGYQVWTGGDISLHGRLIVMMLPATLVLSVDGIIAFTRWLATPPHPAERRKVGTRGALATVIRLAVAVAGGGLLALAATRDWSQAQSLRIIAVLVGSALVLAFVPLLLSGRTVARLTSCLTAIALFGSTMYLAGKRYEPEWRLAGMPRQLWFTVHDVNTAILLDRVLTDDAVLGVARAGAVPYYSQRRSIDFLGKTDKHVARLHADISGKMGWFGLSSVPGHNKYDLEYSIKSLQPDYVELNRLGRQDLSEWVAAHYRAVTVAGGTLFFRKNSPAIVEEALSGLEDPTIVLDSPRAFNWDSVPDEGKLVFKRFRRLSRRAVQLITLR